MLRGLCACLALTAVAAHGEVIARYTLTLDEALAAVDVRIDAGAGVTALRAHGASVRRRLDALGNLTERLERLDVTEPMTYRVSLRHGERQRRVAAALSGRIRLTDWRDFLLTPEGWRGRARLALEFEVPETMDVTAPFSRRAHAPGSVTFEAAPIMLSHDGFVAIGDLEVTELTLAGGQVAVAVVTADPGLRRRYLDWAERVARAVVEVHGTLPQPHVQLAIVPAADGRRSPVPWAHVLRGGGSAIIAYPDPDASRAALNEDWTLYHEFTHLYHPFLDDGRWVGEGLASYYQNVYRARAGVVSTDHAWDRLYAGLERGAREAAARPGRTVTEGGRMRTYWTGAALALAADAELRRRGHPGLDALLGEFARCCLPAARAWRSRDFMQRLDALAGATIFVPLFEEYVRATAFPAVAVERDSRIGRSIMGG